MKNTEIDKSLLTNIHNGHEHNSEDNEYDNKKDVQDYENNKELKLVELQDVIERYVSKLNDEPGEKDDKQAKQQSIVNKFIGESTFI